MRKLVSLQMLRAVAASMVVIDHSLGYVGGQSAPSLAFTQQRWMVGALGVMVFFVTSGLIMMRQSADEFGSLRNAGRFMYRRIVRVVPMYWIATAIAAAGAIRHGATFGQIGLSLAFVPYGIPGGAGTGPVLGQGWTLNYEMFFYVLFAATLLFSRRVGLGLLAAAFLGLAALGTVWRPDGIALAFYTDPLILLFAIGVALGFAEIKIRDWHRIPAPITFSVVLLGLAYAIFVLAPVPFPPPFGWQQLFWVFCAATVFLCTTASDRPVGLGGRVLERAGDASYSTYLFHPFVINALFKAWHVLPQHLQWAPAFVVSSVVVANLAGFAIHLAVERPMTNGLRKLSRERRPATDGEGQPATAKAGQAEIHQQA